ncbi:replicative DNA helicase [Paenibacillus sp. RUD330]|uniref:replicative DNA helicase n=1 Tax=Paenibacillus sp. RUD330 TaxID=2023772 RepID=UPI000B92C581|nr:replicative DNA helicase [Paenibacillus sp. RUD330]ASS66518.1 replicative DNA helicase [Paenibacillus sp. RUD330]
MPENSEAEQVVLGSILIDSEYAMDEVFDRLKGPEFYQGQHRKIYACMEELASDHSPINLVTVTSRLKDKGWLDQVGGVGYLSNLTRTVITPREVGYYVGMLKKSYSQRQLIEDLREQLAQAEQLVDPNEVISDTQSKLEAINELRDEKKGGRPIEQILIDVFEDAEKRYVKRSHGEVTGASSGFTELDRMTAGFQKSDFILVGARPSVGKTAFALNVARNVAVEIRETVAIFSLEMSEKQLVGRMVCAEGNVDAGRFRTGNFEASDWEKMTSAISILGNLPIHIDDTPAVTVSEIRSKCRRIKKEKGLGLILIDYLQLIQGRGKSGENRQEEISHISRTLKQIARELEVPVIALSQLSRGVEQRQDKRPMMSDLRESGSLEQDADIVAFLYRDDYYDKETEKKNIIEIIIAKQRNGPVGTVELAFLKNFNKFVSLSKAEEGNRQ